MEHRWGRRAAVEAAVRLHSGPNAASGRITNASLSGAFVRTSSRLPLFGYILVELPRDDSHHRPPLVPAYVVREAADGLGLEWCEFAPPSIATLLSADSAPAEPSSERRSSTPWRTSNFAP